MTVDNEQVKKAVNHMIDEGKWDDAQRLLFALDAKFRNEAVISKNVAEDRSEQDTLFDSEKRFKEALTDLIDKSVQFAVGKTLLVLRDEGVLKVD